jgi:hypothetical protein
MVNFGLRSGGGSSRFTATPNFYAVEPGTDCDYCSHPKRFVPMDLFSIRFYNLFIFTQHSDAMLIVERVIGRVFDEEYEETDE